MGIFKKGVNWYIDYYLPNGSRRREKIGDNRKLAERVLQKRKIQIMENKFFEIEKPNRVRLKDFSKTYLEKYSKPNKITWIDDEFHLRKLCNYFGDIYLDEISPCGIEEFKRFRLQDGLKYASINRDLACLRTMLNKAVEWDILKKSPMENVKLYKENNMRLRFLEKEGIEKLVNACSPKTRNIVIFTLNTGMRRGEVLNLKWPDIDFQNSFIYLHRTKTKEKRVLPMNQAVKSLLLYLRGRSTGEYVFCNNEGQKIRTFRRAFRNALKRAKIDNFRFHDLRHTFASHLVMNGIDLNTVKELLGHKKIEMTLRYSHVSQDHKTRAVETLGQQMDTIWTPAKIEEKIQKQDFTQPLAIAQ